MTHSLSEPTSSEGVSHNGTPRVPLSKSLLLLLSESDSHTVTLNDLMDQTQGRGLYLMMILLSAPFITPIPLPGVSTAIGLLIAMLAVRLAFGLPPHLPKFLGSRQISRHRLHRVVESSSKLLSHLEKLTKPRRSAWMRWRAARVVNASAIVAMGLLLALPLPPVLPFTNLLPGIAIILLSLAMMERDGILIWAGYAVSFGTLFYLLFFTSLILAAFHRMFGS